MNARMRAISSSCSLLGLAQQLQPRVALDEVVRVGADVVGDRAERDLGDPRHDRVEEEAIVRDEDHRVADRSRVLLEPVARIEIEVVRRLVEQEQRRPAEQQLGERDAHLPAAGKRLGRLVEIRARKPEAL